VDNVSWLCQPPHPSWDILLNAFHTVFQAGGGDGFIGRRLPVLLHAASVQNIREKVTVESPPLGDYRRTHLISLIESVRDKIMVPSGMWLEFGVARSPGNMKVSFQAARSIG
jgi:hypothetical protein